MLEKLTALRYCVYKLLDIKTEHKLRILTCDAGTDSYGRHVHVKATICLKHPAAWIELNLSLFTLTSCFPVNGCEVWCGDELRTAEKSGRGLRFTVMLSLRKFESTTHRRFKRTKLILKNILDIRKLRTVLGNTFRKY